MIGFRDEEPTFAQAAEAAAQYFEEPDEKGDCRGCGTQAKFCDKHSGWCFGMLARAYRDQPFFRGKLLEQLEKVIAMHDWFPKSVEIERLAEHLVWKFKDNSDTLILGMLAEKFPDTQAADIAAALRKARGQE